MKKSPEVTLFLNARRNLYINRLLNSDALLIIGRVLKLIACYEGGSTGIGLYQDFKS